MKARRFPIYSLVAILHIVVATLLETPLFTAKDLHSNKYYIAFKIVSIVVIFVIWKSVYYVFEQYMSGNRWFQCFAKHWCVYGAVMLIVFLLLYPGTLYSDHYRMIEYSLQLSISLNVTYILSYIYILSYMIIPFVTAPVIALAALAVTVTAYIIASMEIACGEKHASRAYFLYIFFLFPSVLYNNVHPHRLQFYSWIYLFLFSSIFFTKLLKGSVNREKLCMWAGLTGLLAMMRTEGCYLLICVPLLLVLMYGIKAWGSKRIIAFVLLSVMSFGVWTIPEEIYENKKGALYQAKRNIVISLSPMSIMLQNPEKYGFSEEDLMDISKIASIESFANAASYTNYYAVSKTIKEYTVEDYNKYMSIYFRTVISHFPSYLAIKWKTFLPASALGDERVAYDTCVPDSKMIEKFPGLKPLNNEMRSTITAFMEGHETGDGKTSAGVHISANKTSTWLYGIFYNILLLLVLLAILLLWGVRTKDKDMVALIGILYVHTFLVFLTATCSRFKHYYPVYLCGYVLLFCKIILSITLKRAKSKQEIDKSERSERS